jgi:hypothetical protein
MALSIVEWRNFKLALGGTRRSVRLVYVRVTCSRSTAYLPKRHDIKVTPPSRYCNQDSYRAGGKERRCERERHVNGKLCSDWSFWMFRQATHSGTVLRGYFSPDSAIGRRQASSVSSKCTSFFKCVAAWKMLRTATLDVSDSKPKWLSLQKQRNASRVSAIYTRNITTS